MRLASIEQAMSMYGRLDTMRCLGIQNFPDYEAKLWRFSPKAMHSAYEDEKLMMHANWSAAYMKMMGLPFLVEQIEPDWAAAVPTKDGHMLEVEMPLVQITMELEDPRTGRRIYMNEKGEKE